MSSLIEDQPLQIYNMNEQLFPVNQKQIQEHQFNPNEIDPYIEYIHSFEQAFWPTVQCPFSYKNLSPKRLLTLGFKCSGYLQLQCIECNQKAKLPQELSDCGLVPVCKNNQDAGQTQICQIKPLIERFILRLKTSTHQSECSFQSKINQLMDNNSLPMKPIFLLQKEFDLLNPIQLTKNDILKSEFEESNIQFDKSLQIFSLKSKKLLILRGQEIFEQIQQTYKQFSNQKLIESIYLSPQEIIHLEKIFGIELLNSDCEAASIQIEEEKVNQKQKKDYLFSLCGWYLITQNKLVGPSLNCICCLKQVPLSILTMIPLIDQQFHKTQKFQFNPLNFHKNTCYFSPFFKEIANNNKCDAVDIFKTLILKNSLNIFDLNQNEKNLTFQNVCQKFKKYKTIANRQIIERIRSKHQSDLDEIQNQSLSISDKALQDSQQMQILKDLKQMVGKRRAINQSSIEENQFQEFEPSVIRQKIEEINEMNKVDFQKLSSQVRNLENYVKRVYAVDQFANSNNQIEEQQKLLEIWKDGQKLINENIEIVKKASEDTENLFQIQQQIDQEEVKSEEIFPDNGQELDNGDQIIQKMIENEEKEMAQDELQDNQPNEIVQIDEQEADNGINNNQENLINIDDQNHLEVFENKENVIIDDFNQIFPPSNTGKIFEDGQINSLTYNENQMFLDYNENQDENQIIRNEQINEQESFVNNDQKSNLDYIQNQDGMSNNFTDKMVNESQENEMHELGEEYYHEDPENSNDKSYNQDDLSLQYLRDQNQN